MLNQMSVWIQDGSTAGQNFTLRPYREAHNYFPLRNKKQGWNPNWTWLIIEGSLTYYYILIYMIDFDWIKLVMW